MQKVNGKVIVPLRGGGVHGHVVRTASGVKLATYYGRDSLARALEHAHQGRSHRRP